MNDDALFSESWLRAGAALILAAAAVGVVLGTHTLVSTGLFCLVVFGGGTAACLILAALLWICFGIKKLSAWLDRTSDFVLLTIYLAASAGCGLHFYQPF